MQKKYAPSNFPRTKSQFLDPSMFNRLTPEAQVQRLFSEVLDLKRRVRECELAYLEVLEEESGDEPDSIELMSSTEEPSFKNQKFN